jgi:hypothetical protein
LRSARVVGARGHLGCRRTRGGFGDANRRFVAAQDQFGCELLLAFSAVVHDGGDRAHVCLDDNPSAHATNLRDLIDDQTRF